MSTCGVAVPAFDVKIPSCGARVVGFVGRSVEEEDDVREERRGVVESSESTVTVTPMECSAACAPTPNWSREMPKKRAASEGVRLVA